MSISNTSNDIETFLPLYSIIFYHPILHREYVVGTPMLKHCVKNFLGVQGFHSKIESILKNIEDIKYEDGYIIKLDKKRCIEIYILSYIRKEEVQLNKGNNFVSLFWYSIEDTSSGRFNNGAVIGKNGKSILNRLEVLLERDYSFSKKDAEKVALDAFLLEETVSILHPKPLKILFRRAPFNVYLKLKIQKQYCK